MWGGGLIETGEGKIFGKCKERSASVKKHGDCRRDR